jgi:RNA polymerase II-associated protein 1
LARNSCRIMDSSLLIGDIVERKLGGGEAKAPEPPEVSASSTGFPSHKKRHKVSAFKQQRLGGGVNRTVGASARGQDELKETEGMDASSGSSIRDADRRNIDMENQRRLGNMSRDEIERAQRELLNGLNPETLQRLLRRANIDEAHGKSPFDPHPTEERAAPPEIKIEDTSKPAPEPLRQPDIPKAERRDPEEKSKSPSTKPFNEDEPPDQPPADLFPISDQPERTHFPAPPVVPDLDPSDPDFLATLHEKFFPDLPIDPSKLAWMAPIPTEDSAADRDSPYHPAQSSLPVSVLRFDFRGALLPPRLSRSIPVSKGLHHHGEAPEAAGYTIGELAILARSAVPAQRCVAFQTLGRILYRLGKGDWGTNDEDSVAMGLWRNVREGRVIDSLYEAATAENGHQGSRAYATEALWLFDKGGWKESWPGR